MNRSPPPTAATRHPPESVGAVLAEVQLLLANLPDPRREAIALCAAVLGHSRASMAVLLDDPVPDGLQQQVRLAAHRRAKGEPLAYLTGQREFWSLQFEVSPAVLVPRPDTETLVERALQLGDALAARTVHGEGTEPLRLVDLGTGSGAIAISIAVERPQWTVHASDCSPEALQVAHRNAARLGASQVVFAPGDWLGAWPAQRFDLVLANPPYVAADDPAMQGDGLRHEPRAALTPGADGLAALRRIAEQAPASMRAGAWLLLEHGATQAPAVAAMLVARGFSHVVSRPDLAGLPRCTEGQWI